MGQTPTRRRGPQGKPAQQGSPQWVRSGDGVKSVVTEKRLWDDIEASLESRRAANPERYGPVEHFVPTKGGKGRWIPLEQKYRPAEHGSKPIPVHDARYYGDN